MGLVKEGMAAIFYKDKSNDFLALKSVALVNYNSFTRMFFITSGEFAGKTNSDFNKIIKY